MRKRPSRFEVSVGLSVLLLLYFLTSVSTGIFWVAAQELPIFDWHYIPGYILLMVGLAHVVLHWNSVALFLRKRAPRAVVETDGTGFRGWVKTLSLGFLGILVCGVTFMVGTRYASQNFQFSEGAGDAVSVLGMSAGEEGKPIAPRRLRTAPVTVTLAQLYHDGCSYPNRFNLPGITLRVKPPVYKEYTDKPVVKLPPWETKGGSSVLEAYGRWYDGTGSDQASITLNQLSTLLYYTQGISKTLERPGMTFELRTAASAGALYPVNTYVLVHKVDGVAPGIYYYDPKQAALVQVKDGDPTEALAGASGSPEAIRSAPVTVLFTATFGRTAFKYGERSYRYVAMDTGHASYNLALSAGNLGLRAPLVGRFDDAQVNQLMGLEAATEFTLLIQPIGSAPVSKDAEPRFLSSIGTGAGLKKGSLLDLIHGGTGLRKGKTVGPRVLFPEMDAPGKGRLNLPAPAKGSSLLPTIMRRRSVRDYSGKTMEQDELSALCAASAGFGKAPVSADPLWSGSSPLDLYLFVRDVRGLAQGIYRYHPNGHSLELVRTGDFAKAIMKACLEQEFCGTANVVFFKTINWDNLSYPDGDRGYRYACLRAGFMGEGLYLQGTALDIGVCGVGAFSDGAVGKILDLDPAKDVCLYVTAAGKL
jgi:SagB-type dehydrogenase family enzyme